jgi:hypothetical protein
MLYQLIKIIFQVPLRFEIWVIYHSDTEKI